MYTRRDSSIVFKLMQIEDLSKIYQWFQIPHIKKWYAREQRYTEKMIAEKYIQKINDPENIPNYIIYYDTIPIGYIQMYRLSFALPDDIAHYEHHILSEFDHNDIVGIDFFIADQLYLGKGISSIVFREFIDMHVKGKFQAAIVDPIIDNKLAIAFFERNGFKKLTPPAGANHILMIYRVNQV